MANANISALALNTQNYISPPINGSTLGFSLGTGSTSILSQNPQVQKIYFINVSTTVIVYVCQAKDANGSALTPGANPGNIPVFPGGMVVFTGNGAGAAWLAACAVGGSAVPFTVITSQTP